MPLARTLALALPLAALASACAPNDDGARAQSSAIVQPPTTIASAAPRVVPTSYANALRQTIRELDGRVGLAPYLAFDRKELETRALSLLGSGGRDLDEGFRLGARAIQRAYPVGHLVFAADKAPSCGTASFPIPATSLLGACTQPYRDHAVVSVAMNGNPLKLSAGDEIVAVNGNGGEAMLGAALDRPLCGASGSPSPSHQRAIAATTLLATVEVGSTVTIKRVTGAIETATVTHLSPTPMTCSDPFAREGAYAARATLRPDGVAVLHVPSFYPSDYDDADPMGSVDRFEGAIRGELAKVRNAAALVIDVRGNGGGFPYVALRIAGGLPGAVAKTISRCDERVANTNEYRPSPPLDVMVSGTFAMPAKVAVLSDGLSFSATDVFLRAVRTASAATIVGRPSAGAYGSSDAPVAIAGGAELSLYVDPWRCVDETGALLEGQSIPPHVEQDLSPELLARGIDSDLETAVLRLR